MGARLAALAMARLTANGRNCGLSIMPGGRGPRRSSRKLRVLAMWLRGFGRSGGKRAFRAPDKIKIFFPRQKSAQRPQPLLQQSSNWNMRTMGVVDINRVRFLSSPQPRKADSRSSSGETQQVEQPLSGRRRQRRSTGVQKVKSLQSRRVKPQRVSKRGRTCGWGSPRVEPQLRRAKNAGRAWRAA